MVDEVAAQLRAHLVAPPHHVAFLLPPGIGYVLVELGVWACGAVAVPLSVHSPAPELAYFCEDSDAEVLVGAGATLPALAPVALEGTALRLEQSGTRPRP